MSLVGSGRLWLLAVVAGLVLGVVGLGLEHLESPWSDLSSLGSPWLIVAFGVGGAVGKPKSGMLGGVAALFVANLSYYLAKAIFGSPLNPLEYDRPMYWVVAAIPAGALLGWIGGLWRSGGRNVRILSVAAVAGMVLTEAFWHRTDDVVWAIMVAIGAALPLVLLRGVSERALGVVASAGLALLFTWLADLLLPLLI